MFEVSQVKVSHGAVLSCWCEHALVLSKTDIVNRFIMGYKLRLYNFFFNVPDCASGINTRSSNHIHCSLVPVEARKRSTKFVLLKETFVRFYGYIGKLALQRDALWIFSNLPNSEVFTRCRNQIVMRPSLHAIIKKCRDTYLIRNPHNLCGWIFVLKVCAVLKIPFVLVQLNYFDLIADVFAVWAESEAEVFLLSVAEIDRVEWPLGLMCVYLLPLSRSLLLLLRICTTCVYDIVIIIFTFLRLIIRLIITCSWYPLTNKLRSFLLKAYFL